MPNDLAQLPSLAEVMERVRMRRAQEQMAQQQPAIDLAQPSSGAPMPRRDAPQWNDPYIEQAMRDQEMDRIIEQEVAADQARRLPAARTFEPSGPPLSQAMPRTFEPSGPPVQQSMAGRTFEPSGPPMPAMAQLSPQDIQARVEAGQMDPRVARMLLDRQGAF